jgi:hypothetical protein
MDVAPPHRHRRIEVPLDRPVAARRMPLDRHDLHDAHDTLLGRVRL